MNKSAISEIQNILPIIKIDVINILINIIILIYIIITLVIILKLFLYHLNLSKKGITTYQEIKKVYEKDFDFYSTIKKSKCSNLFNKFCRKNAKAFFEPSGVYMINEMNLNLKHEDKKCEVISIFEKKDNDTDKIQDLCKYTSKSHIDYKIPPGEIQFSDNDVDNIDLEIKLPTDNSDKDSLNKKIFSVINSSGTIENDQSDELFAECIINNSVQKITKIDIQNDLQVQHHKPELSEISHNRIFEIKQANFNLSGKVLNKIKLNDLFESPDIANQPLADIQRLRIEKKPRGMVIPVISNMPEVSLNNFQLKIKN